MASLAKIVVATGASGGVGFEAIKQLLEQSQPYRVILGVRNTKNTQALYDDVKYDKAANDLTILPLDLLDTKGVKSFAQTVLEKLGPKPIDYLFLNAGMIATHDANEPGPSGSKWCDSYVVNHLTQHYLIHLLRQKLESSKTRIVVTSSGGIRGVSDPAVLDTDFLAKSATDGRKTYGETKFTQLLGAHWWRRQLAGKCEVVATSPGLVPLTGLARRSPLKLTMDMPDAISVPQGGANLLRAFFITDFPEDPDRIFLTSWGEWWEKSVIEKSLDKALQDKWCPSKDEIEKELGLSS